MTNRDQRATIKGSRSRSTARRWAETNSPIGTEHRGYTSKSPRIAADSTFTVTDSTGDSLGIMARTKHCLLIVDDEPNVCDSVHDLLRREFRVLKAHSADEGYQLMQQEEVHIVMSDQRMPQISGVELLTKLKARYPQAIRMLFTGFADLESVIAAINQGHIFQFIRKPWQPEDLLMAVRQAAAEYDRLESVAREREQLLEEIDNLNRRLSVLESDVRNLKAAPNAWPRETRPLISKANPTARSSVSPKGRNRCEMTHERDKMNVFSVWLSERQFPTPGLVRTV